MLKQKEYKFWFCTGSQDLYGDECLAHVAEHSKIIVEKLNDDFFAHILAHEINHLVDTALFLFGASDFDNHALPSSLSASSRYFFKYQSAFLISSTPFLFLCR